MIWLYQNIGKIKQQLVRQQLKQYFLLFSLFVFHVFVLTGSGGIGRIFFGVALAVSVALMFTELVPLFLILFLIMSARFYIPQDLLAIPSLVYLIPFLITLTLLIPFKNFRGNFDWLHVGIIDRRLVLVCCSVAFLALLMVIFWDSWSGNWGPATNVVKRMGKYPLALALLVFIPGYALLNAAAEEVVYRGVVQESLGRIFGQKGWLTHIGQASAFAVVHIMAGFPEGLSGYLLVFAFSLGLGWMRTYSEGIFASFITHVWTDLAIGYFLYFRLVL